MKSSLICLIVVILGVQIWADSAEKIELTKFIEDSKCLAKEKLIFAEVIDFALNDKLELAEKNPQLKCFAACLLEHAKILDGCMVVYNKNMDIDALPIEAKEEFVKQMESCRHAVKGSDRCECAYQLNKCLVEKSKKP